MMNQVIPGLPQGCIVVLYNASYQNKQENKASPTHSLKCDIEDWLSRNNINFNAEMRKCELLTLVRQNRPRVECRIDALLRGHGFTPMSFPPPPYHLDLNPIEYVWNLTKMKVAEKNMGEVSITYLKILVLAVFNTITPDDWRRSIKHVRKTASDYWTRDGLMEEAVEQLIISVSVDDELDDENEDGCSTDIVDEFRSSADEDEVLPI
ncbi:hypothetical protein ANN_26303 [Periplaneta americana]|uniref:Tc1-like transposase DDE domain-containing protein n=1 Tax=Periplaneta americana TaxID=6978 RepID=A0ABQ8S5J3_PERAM|nr:hypothetical protein ANN_26303 [Periplaneta americana]